MKQQALGKVNTKRWKSKVKDSYNVTSIELRGNKKWCEKYGEDLTKPRYIGDRYYIKNGVKLYPPYKQQAGEACFFI